MGNTPNQSTKPDDDPPIDPQNSWSFHRLWFTRLSRAALDMQLAAKYGRLALTVPGRDNETRYAYTLALVILYSRPFTMARGFRAHGISMKLDAAALPYTDDEHTTHTGVVDARHGWWAHTDAAHFEALPIENDDPDGTVHIEHRLTSFSDDELRQIVAMAEKARAYFADERQSHRLFLERIGDVVRMARNGDD